MGYKGPVDAQYTTETEASGEQPLVDKMIWKVSYLDIYTPRFATMRH